MLSQEIKSPSTKVNLLEVYTSQGCSSCPPAEDWLTQFENNSRLWNEFIPLNFHVDYWDYLGWKDPFASDKFSTRQRNFKRLGLSKTVATPGFILNGQAWNGWFYRQALPLTEQNAPGLITATLKDDLVSVNYRAASQIRQSLTVNVAVLGFNLATYIKRGENRGKELIHDFVVLAHTEKPMMTVNTTAIADLTVPSISQFNAKKTALVVWVADQSNPIPIQAAGDWITDTKSP
ncbi:hypothetical protein GCM10022277_10990 [Litoribacillus peritrichatus]|uniref:DUF1223 domain-containing protein n=1 Tax=Litoribacillus peritrichatus TaxID=718191 RepID=A0ABP7MC64_9GAMM